MDTFVNVLPWKLESSWSCIVYKLCGGQRLAWFLSEFDFRIEVLWSFGVSIPIGLLEILCHCSMHRLAVVQPIGWCIKFHHRLNPVFEARRKWHQLYLLSRGARKSAMRSPWWQYHADHWCHFFFVTISQPARWCSGEVVSIRIDALAISYAGVN